MVNPKLDGLGQEKLGASATSGQDVKSLSAYRGRAVPMSARKKKLAELDLASKQQLPEETWARGFNVIRARGLASQI